MSAKAETRCVRLYEDDLHAALRARAPCRGLPARTSAPSWRGSTAEALDLASVRTADLLAYQSELYARGRRTAGPTRSATKQNRLSALKSFFRFLVRRGYLLHDPAAALEMPRARERGSRAVILTQGRGAEDHRGASGQDARAGCATARSWRRSTPPASAPAS